MMVVALFAVLAGCQLFGCAPQDPADQGCCPRHAAPKVPCLHGLLAKGKAGSVLARGGYAAPVAQVPVPAISESLSAVQTETRLPDRAGSYLRNRVLLI